MVKVLLSVEEEMLYYFPREEEMLSKATVCAILYLSLGTYMNMAKKNIGRVPPAFSWYGRL